MLDDHNAERRPLSFPERYTLDPVATHTLSEAWRDLFARLTGRGRSAAPQAEADPSPSRHDNLPEGLRAEAHAAFLSVEGEPRRALDAALAVMERRIATLQQAVGCYGEALKTIQVYAADETSRTTARAALRATPEKLAAAQPVPHFAGLGHRHA